ncbi:hypothetical protein ACTI_82960 [Actinoplanes sp. OR16]|nr:hypothetical protein ACTI_82960 [Actinoplanes sp. OR16]
MILGVAGLVAMTIGAASFLAPEAFHEMSGTTGSLNETRANGGGLLGAGTLIFLGAIRRPATAHAAVLGAVLYLGYALGRLLSATLDPAPNAGLVTAMVAELALGVACVFAYRRAT